MRALRLLLMVIYASYLTNAGLLMILLPWSDAWSRLLLMMSPRVAVWLDSPLLRGGVTAFGVLHLLLVLAEVFVPAAQASKDP